MHITVSAALLFEARSVVLVVRLVVGRPEFDSLAESDKIFYKLVSWLDKII